jgi:hypothetical protein
VLETRGGGERNFNCMGVGERESERSFIGNQEESDTSTVPVSVSVSELMFWRKDREIRYLYLYQRGGGESGKNSLLKEKVRVILTVLL